MKKLTETQIKKIIKEMVIFVDTREKKNNHILYYFKQNKIEYKEITMKTGDYGFYLKPTMLNKKGVYIKGLIIERKNSLEEFSKNITTSKENIRGKNQQVTGTKIIDTRQRFINEMTRAKKNKQMFIVMFEREPVAYKCFVCNKLDFNLEKQCKKCGSLRFVYLYEDFHEQIYGGHYKTLLNNNAFAGTVYSFKNGVNYNNKFEAVPKHLAGKFIYDTFKYYLRSRLKNIGNE